MYSVYRHTTPNGKVYIGITQQEPNICKCCKGIRKTAAGYHWRYAEEVVL